MLTHDVGTAECLEVGGPGMSLFLMLYVFAAGMDYDDTILQILFFLAPAVQKIVQKENIRENKNLPFDRVLNLRNNLFLFLIFNLIFQWLSFPLMKNVPEYQIIIIIMMMMRKYLQNTT